MELLLKLLGLKILIKQIRVKVNLGDYVTVNTVIAGSGGGESYDYCTTGPHLHFSIMKGKSYLQPRNYVSFPAKGKKFTSRY